MNRHCTRCKEFKTVEEFGSGKSRKDGKYSWCKVCVNKHSSDWYYNNKDRAITSRKNYYKSDPSRAKASARRSRLSIYGIDENIFNEMYSQQNGRCKICGIHQDSLNTRLSVDHCHDSGRVRGLLCKPCNSAIGLLKHSADILISALSYIKENK